MSLDIYIAEESSTSGLYVPNLSTKLATASIDVSTLTTNTYPSTLTSFNYTGDNAITLSANTNYTFYLNASQITFPVGSSGINYLLNSADPYPNGNFFNNNNPTGSSSYNMSGQIDVTTAVPEPGTLILTGSALLAGAIGVYFTRRHRDQALTHAAV